MNIQFRIITLSTMKPASFLLCLTYATCHRNNLQLTYKEKVVEGKFMQISKIPYQASVEFDGRIECSAAIIAKYWLISAVHCFINREDISGTGKIRTGTSFREQLGNIFEIKRVILHPSFSESALDNNIALIELTTAITFTINQQPIPITKSKDAVKPGRKMIVCGYGSFLKSPIKAATVKILPNRDCNKIYYDYPLTENMFCAQSAPDTMSYGDTGGPGVIKGNLVGIIFNGGRQLEPSTYIKIFPYYDWIQENANITV